MIGFCLSDLRQTSTRRPPGSHQPDRGCGRDGGPGMPSHRHADSHHPVEERRGPGVHPRLSAQTAGHGSPADPLR